MVPQSDILQFQQILQPLQSANLLSEYHYQIGNMSQFHQKFRALEVSYAQIYAQVAAVEQRIAKFKSSDKSL